MRLFDDRQRNRHTQRRRGCRNRSRRRDLQLGNAAGEEPVVTTSMGLFASLQPTTEGEFTWQSVVPVVALGGVSQNSLDYI